LGWAGGKLEAVGEEGEGGGEEMEAGSGGTQGLIRLLPGPFLPAAPRALLLAVVWKLLWRCAAREPGVRRRGAAVRVGKGRRRAL